MKCLVYPEKPDVNTECVLCEMEFECNWVLGKKTKPTQDLKVYMDYYYSVNKFFDFSNSGVTISTLVSPILADVKRGRGRPRKGL